MKRPLANKRPIGPFSQMGKSGTLHLKTDYDVPREFGIDLEDRSMRERLENELENQLENKLIAVEDAELHPAGSIVGVVVDTGRSVATSEYEDNILNIIDRFMKDKTRASRPAPDNPDYEWQIR